MEGTEISKPVGTSYYKLLNKYFNFRFFRMPFN